MRKQSLTHEDFLDIKKKAEKRPIAEIDNLIDDAVFRISKFAKNRKLAFSWSGGKDSLALQYVCEQAGISDCVLGVSQLEYPAFMKWVTNNMPEGLSVINTGFGLQQILKKPELLFPQNATLAATWFKNVQHKAQAQYYKQHNLDGIILGRRYEDGNFCGRDGNDFYTSKGVLRYSPIAKWTHSDIFAVLHAKGIEEPPFYSWARGYRCGTHPWAARQWCESELHGWREVYQIDSDIVHEMADFFKGAKRVCVEYSGM
ncbi:hypothetical protein [Vibrio harveyi]|uniref:hypothetical protein n=1 Tax=Vibrio harveyi TaxID=669 RepID=UPI003CE709D1